MPGGISAVCLLRTAARTAHRAVAHSRSGRRLLAKGTLPPAPSQGEGEEEKAIGGPGRVDGGRGIASGVCGSSGVFGGWEAFGGEGEEEADCGDEDQEDGCGEDPADGDEG